MLFLYFSIASIPPPPPQDLALLPENTERKNDKNPLSTFRSDGEKYFFYNPYAKRKVFQIWERQHFAAEFSDLCSQWIVYRMTGCSFEAQDKVLGLNSMLPFLVFDLDIAFDSRAEVVVNDTRVCRGLALCAMQQVAYPVAFAIEIIWKLFT